MATEGFVKFEYFSKGVPPYYGNSSFPELLDDEKITIETPTLEMNYHQYYGLFKKFLMSVGFSEKNIIQGACSLAFNEMNDEKTMREVADEYELIMSEDLPDIIADRKKQDNEWIDKTNPQWEERYWALYRKMQEIETAKYTDEELDAMCDKAASDEADKRREYNLREEEYYNKRAELDSSFLAKDRNSNFPGENTVCDKDDPSDECKEHWNDFWDSETSIADKVQEGYNYWHEDMCDQGVMKVTTNDPMKAWNGYIPGTPAAQAVGCICPVLDNEEMPDDVKWIDVECPIHGRKK
jgi:hypothetical protein